MRIVITGSKGMLGYDLVERLKMRYVIIGFDLDDFDIVDGDVIGYISKQKPDFLFHLAAYTNVDKAEEERKRVYNVNVNGVRNIAMACKAMDIPMVFISTDYIFDGTKETPYTEDDYPKPINYYGETKSEGEKLITKSLKKFFIVRTSWLFGKNGKNFVKTITSIPMKKESIEVVDDQYGSPTYTRDLAVSLELFLQSEQYGIYHITNRGSCSWFDFAKMIVLFSGRKTTVIPIKSDVLMRPAKRPQNSVLDNLLFEKRFKYRMPTWDDALRRYLIEDRCQKTENRSQKSGDRGPSSDSSDV
jgi:dTDP-4-dehydrorhamnose reductase